MLYTCESGSPAQPAIVFLHGGGLSSRMWQPVMEHLPDFYCLAPDLPEHGQSRSISPFDLDDAARRVAESIRLHLPGGRAHLVGLSLGGAVALNVARLDPHAIHSLMVTGTAAKLGKFLGQLSLSSLWMLRLYKPEDLARRSATQYRARPLVIAIWILHMHIACTDIPFRYKKTEEYDFRLVSLRRIV